ncbi:MAG: marine proteobacterial sortase target protein [Proteobacteria bacterium]|nr:marine proteobacterial sortase target protein [Pseudomonadota bacterium]MDA0992213.1 marine proteobacterial sortase target protein [Pseudomonadota bacterium]
MGNKRAVRAGIGRQNSCNKRSCWHPYARVEARPRPANNPPRQGSRNWLAVVLVVLMSGSVVARTSDDVSDDVSPGAMQSGSLLLKMEAGYAVATRMNTEIDASISGLVARVTVRQEFRNHGNEWVEGVYVFPLPDTAAVDRLKMHIGERFIEGEIREKAEAKKEYEAAKAAGRKASLVEQERANLFTTSVANIGPGETVSIEIGYLETLRIDEGTFNIRFPLTFTPRYIPGTPLPGRKGSGWSRDTTTVPDASRITLPVVANSNEHRVAFHAELDAGVPVEFVASRYHPIDVRPIGTSNTDDRYTIDLFESNVPMDHDLELTWKPVPDTAPRAMLFTESVGGQPHVLLMMLPPNDSAAQKQSIPRDLIFVIDTSGSMHGTSLDQAKRALTMALDGLNVDDRFNVIQFNSATSALFAESVAATEANINVARRYVAGLSANGGTEMRPALLLSLSTPVSESHLRQIIFITDGSVGNEDELFTLIEGKLGLARLFTVGIGSAPNSLFMRKAAEAGRGTFTFISALHEVNEKMGRLFRNLEQPQLTDIVIEWPDGVVAETYPSVVPDLYAGEPVFVRARLDAAARDSDIITVRGNSVTGSWGAEMPINISRPSPGIAALWARARIGEFMDRERRGASAEEVRKSVVETALAHHLVSKHTSLVAVDKTPVRPQTAFLDSEQVPNLLPYGQSVEAIFGFPATATGAGALLVHGLALIVLALLLLGVLGRRPQHVLQIDS